MTAGAKSGILYGERTAMIRPTGLFTLLGSLAVFALQCLSVAYAAGTCDGWDAVYTSAADHNGTRITVRFGETEDSSTPIPFHLHAVDGKGGTLWRHRGHAWCYQGSGGCFAGLSYRKKKDTEDEGSNRMPLVFAHASPLSKRESTPDLLIVGGISSAFHYGQGPEGIVLSDVKDADAHVLVPEVYYFDRCVAK